MTVSAPLILTQGVIKRLHRLREIAAERPVDVLALMASIQTEEGKRAHQERMDAQTIRIDGPWSFFVTISIETGQPVGPCRHMSMSILREGRVPAVVAIETIAAELGFVGGLANSLVWEETLSDGGVAINALQPVDIQAAGSA